SNSWRIRDFWTGRSKVGRYGVALRGPTLRERRCRHLRNELDRTAVPDRLRRNCALAGAGGRADRAGEGAGGMGRSRWFRSFCVANLVLILAAAAWYRTTSLTMRVPNGDEARYGAKAADLLDGKGIGWQTESGNVMNVLVILPEI